MKKLLVVSIVAVSFLIVRIPVVKPDIQGECGTYLREAMDIGVQIQQLKAEKRHLHHRIDTGRSRDWRADRRRTGELHREIRALERNYEIAAERFAQCVEDYKRELKRQYRNGEVTREEYKLGFDEAMHMVDQLVPIPGKW